MIVFLEREFSLFSLLKAVTLTAAVSLAVLTSSFAGVERPRLHPFCGLRIFIRGDRSKSGLLLAALAPAMVCATSFFSGRGSVVVSKGDLHVWRVFPMNSHQAVFPSSLRSVFGGGGISIPLLLHLLLVQIYCFGFGDFGCYFNNMFGSLFSADVDEVVGSSVSFDGVGPCAWSCPASTPDGFSRLVEADAKIGEYSRSSPLHFCEGGSVCLLVRCVEDASSTATVFLGRRSVGRNCYSPPRRRSYVGEIRVVDLGVGFLNVEVFECPCPEPNIEPWTNHMSIILSLRPIAGRNVRAIRASKNECTSAVALKWMLNQGLMKHHEEIVEYFKTRGVSANFLFRRNLLRRMISVLANSYDRNAKLLNGSHKSHVHSPKEAEILACYKPLINTILLIADLKQVQEMTSKALSYFNTTRHIFLHYEDVVKNRTKLDDVQEFLKVPKLDLKSQQVKIHHGPFSQHVQNWEDVQTTLKGTGFENFLLEDYRK
ncbi:unnamed protein product [Arabis nemorensis]|uniref:Sulfotransferase n=1 Tax=Arabis nemorensis TaxID=586526 RepID=A0A565BAZ4_9BRAS|nr:unnamed protein product [Arabis nemorensis]